MKKHLIIIILITVFYFFLAPAAILGQNNFEDVVYLKNGSIIHGMIIEQIPGTSVKIECSNHNVYVFKTEDIEKITREPVIVTPFIKKKLQIDSVKQRGFTITPEINFSRKNFSGDEFGYSWGIDLTAGYLINPHISVGGGTGLEYNTYALYLPLFAALRYNILNKSVTPYITAEGGYSLIIKGGFPDYIGGLRFKGSLGIKFFVSRHIALNFTTGFKYQEFSYKYDYAWWLPAPDCYNYTISGAYKLLEFSVGMTY
jgi:hypothetical protein